LINSVAFSPCGTIIASGSSDNTVKLWNIETGNLKKTLEHLDEITAVAFNPGNSTLASSSYNGKIILWDINTGRVKKTLPEWMDAVYTIAFTPIIDRSHAVHFVNRVSNHLLPDVANVAASFMFGNVHSNLVDDAVSAEYDDQSIHEDV